MSKSWVLITPEDTCAWKLKEAHLGEEEPTLEQLQMYVGGRIEAVPSSWLMDGLHIMYVNEEGVWDKLPHNQLATQLLDMGGPLVGTVVVQWDSKYNTIKGWTMSEEE